MEMSAGWAIDAVAGRQTRPHDDLDLVARLEEIPALERELASLGYERAGGGPLCSFESVDAAGRQVDVHPVAEDGAYRMRDGGIWHYPVEAQLHCRGGYDPVDPEKHRRDLDLLHRLRA